MSCCDGWHYEDNEINGECPECGNPTVDGQAQSGCYWSSVVCKTCGDAPCDLSC